MRIVHVVRQFAPSIGGLEDVVLNLCRQQVSRSGCSARVVTLDRLFGERDRRLAAEDDVEGVRVTRIPFVGSRRYPIAPAAINAISDADVVHVHGIDFFFDFLALTRPLHGKTLVATTHGGFFHTSFAARLKRVYFLSITRASSRFYERIIACSESDRRTFERIAADRVVTIENGINLRKLAGSASSRYARTLIYFGRLSPHKRLALLFPILRHLRIASPAWRLIIAGREDGITFADLAAEASREGVGDAIALSPNPSDRDLARLAGEASYFISPSAYEGFGVAVLEAMSAGLYPIMSNIAPFERFARLAGCGILVDPASPETACRAILAVDSRPVGSLEVDKEKLARAAEAYDWSRVTDAYVDQYVAALARRRDSSCTHS